MRLRRGGRNKETLGNSAANTAPAVAVLPDEPDPIQWAPRGSVLGLSKATADPSEGPINEWGLYDPDLAGFGALMSTLDTSEIPIPPEIEEDPGDLLLRQQNGDATAAIKELETDSPFDTKMAPVPSAAAAVASCRVGHLAPLSLWARLAEGDAPVPAPARLDTISRLLAEWMPKVAPRRASPFAGSDLAAKIGRLTHPAHVAVTSLSPVCRIREIRTTPVVVITEPVDELPGWLQPNIVPLPESVTVEALQNAVITPMETEALPAPVSAASQLPPVSAVAELSPAPVASASAEFVEARAESGRDAVADLEVATVVPPSLDALPIDFMTAALPADDVASFETLSFERHPAPPIEFNLVAAVQPVANEAPFGPVFGPAADVAPEIESPSFEPFSPPSTSDIPLADPLADEPSSVVPASDAEDTIRAERSDAAPSVAHPEATRDEPVAVVADPPPAIPVVPVAAAMAVASPAKKRRRAAMALG